MARKQPVNFQRNYKIEFVGITSGIEFWTKIRGHHVYKVSWTPESGERVICFNDNRSETLEYDTHAIGAYKKVEEPDERLKPPPNAHPY